MLHGLRRTSTGIVSDDYDGIDSKQDSEIHFLPSITLDNGLKIGANVQLEGFQGGDQIDESFLFIDGSFGRVLLGSENSAGYLMHYGAPDVTFLNVNSGSLTAFVPFSGSVVGQRIGTAATSSRWPSVPISSAARSARPISRTASTTTRSASPTSRRASPASSSASPMRATRPGRQHAS